MAVETTIKLVPKESKKLVRAARKGVRLSLRETLHEVGKTLRKQIKLNVSGKILQIRTGDLYRSIYFRVEKDELKVGAAVPYAMYLETSTRIRPSKRRFMSRSMEEKKADIRKIFGKMMRKSFKYGY